MKDKFEKYSLWSISFSILLRVFKSYCFTLCLIININHWSNSFIVLEYLSSLANRFFWLMILPSSEFCLIRIRIVMSLLLSKQQSTKSLKSLLLMLKPTKYHHYFSKLHRNRLQWMSWWFLKIYLNSNMFC